MVKVTLWSLMVAAAVGLAYYWVMTYVWGLYSAGNPINDALLDVLMRRGHSLAYRVAISAHDLVVNVLLALPFAAALRFFRALRSRTHVALATAAAVIAGYGPIEWQSLPLLLSHWTFWVGLSMAALSLPLAFVLLSRFRPGEIRPSIARDAA